jgi:hypothetical protein
MEIFWRMMFEILIAYFDMHDALMKIAESWVALTLGCRKIAHLPYVSFLYFRLCRMEIYDLIWSKIIIIEIYERSLWCGRWLHLVGFLFLDCEEL